MTDRKNASSALTKVNVKTGFVFETQMFTRGDNANPVAIRTDVSKITKETALALILFGIKEKFNNATCNPKAKTREDKIKEVERVRDAIEGNALSERATGYTDRQELAISLYRDKVLGGKMPSGGKATVWKVIGEMTKERSTKFWAHVDATLSLDF